MMASIPWPMVALAWAAGLCMPLGGVIAQLERSHESHVKRSWLAGITALGGGILYRVFQDIAPQSRVAHHWSPPLGASLGFMIGMLGDRLVG